MTQAFNLSQLANKVNTSGQLDAATGLSGVAPVANGGTGAASLTANNVILGNGTSAVQVVAPSTSGNVLTSNGSTWISAAGSSYAGFSTVVFASSTTWAVPTGVTKARITVIGGGGGGTNQVTGGSTYGGAGGFAIAYCTGISGTLTITIGTGGVSAVTSNTAAGAGTASSITGTGVSISGSGGGGAINSTTNGTNGVGTVTTGTALQSGGAVLNNAVRGGTTASVTNAGNAYENYLGDSIAIAKNQAVSNPTSGGAGIAFAVGGQAPAGVGGYSRQETKSVGGVVIIEY